MKSVRSQKNSKNKFMKDRADALDASAHLLCVTVEREKINY